jgi:23S rRNA (uracil1939-C5)-methyltransferase
LGELKPYDAVVLDPPRAGAQGQARILAKSKIPTIAYVSCDAASFARDAAILLAGGYVLGPVTPIDQFLWSSHIELVAGFERPQAAKR